MAEKEQRIWLEYDIPKPKGAVEAFRCTTMTRTEAINRMAKALRSNIVETQAQCSCLNMAEAALNALLEGK